VRVYLVFILLCLFLPRGSAEEKKRTDASSLKAIKASRIYLDDGTVVNDGCVIVKEGRIHEIGTGFKLPGDFQIFVCRSEGELTPGLIDAACTAGIISKSSWAEHSDEVVPELLTIDAVDLGSQEFNRLAERGVTTVYITPGPGSVIGGRGAVVKTAGPPDERVLNAESAVGACLGPEAWQRGAYNRTPGGNVTFMTRRPTTRMGMTWVFRKAFHDAGVYKAKRAKQGDERPGHDPSLEILAKVLDDEIPFRIQARKDIDIWSAIRFAKEFGFKVVLEEGLESYRCIPELKECGACVIFGPIFVDAGGWRRNVIPCLNTAGLLADAGIPLALTAGGLEGEDALPGQACLAIRFGLPFSDALVATTATPARILDLADRIGAIRPGLDADLVLWNGKPFSPASKPALVMIGGEVVYMDDEMVSTEGSAAGDKDKTPGDKSKGQE